MLAAHVFSVENRFVFDHDICDVQGVAEYNKSLFVNCIPEWERDVPTRCRGQVPSISGTSASYWKKPLRPDSCSKMKHEMCYEQAWKSLTLVSHGHSELRTCARAWREPWIQQDVPLLALQHWNISTNAGEKTATWLVCADQRAHELTWGACSF